MRDSKCEVSCLKRYRYYQSGRLNHYVQPNSKPLNLVLLPDAVTAAKAVKLAQRLANRYKCEFTLDEVGVIPHVTVYQLECPLKNLDELSSTISSIAKATTNMSLVANSIGMLPGRFVAWIILPNDKLEELHNCVLEKANPLREGMFLERGIPHSSGRSPLEDENLRRYGMTLVGSLYTPHITLGGIARGASVDASALSRVLRVTPSTFEVKEILITKLNDTRRGTISEILERFALGP